MSNTSVSAEGRVDRVEPRQSSSGTSGRGPWSVARGGRGHPSPSEAPGGGSSVGRAGIPHSGLLPQHVDCPNAHRLFVANREWILCFYS